MYIINCIKYLSSYNHFKNKQECEIFSIYKEKDKHKTVSKFKTKRLKDFIQNPDGSYSLTNLTPAQVELILQQKLQQKETSHQPTKKYSTFFKVLKNDNVFIVALKLKGFSINNLDVENQQSFFKNLHQIIKSIPFSHSLIKISQPVSMNNVFQQHDANKLFKYPLDQKVVFDEITKLKDGYLERIKHQDIRYYENNWYIMIYDFNNKMNELLTMVRFLKENLELSTKIQTEILTNQQITNVLVSCFNPLNPSDNNDLLEEHVNIDDMIKFDKISFGKHVITHVPNLKKTHRGTVINPETHMKIGIIDSYPKQNLPALWLEYISNSTDTLVIHNQMADPEIVKKRLHQSLQNTELIYSMFRNKVKKQETIHAYKQFEELVESVSSDNEVIFDTSIYTINYSFSSPEDALKSFNSTKNLIRQSGFVLRPLTFRQREAFSDIFIKPRKFINMYNIPIPSYCLAISNSFHNETISDSNGTYIGHTKDNNLINFDLFELNEIKKNANQMVIGTSGSGKSTYLKKI